jgi:hypothetical protein
MSCSSYTILLLTAPHDGVAPAVLLALRDAKQRVQAQVRTALSLESAKIERNEHVSCSRRHAGVATAAGALSAAAEGLSFAAARSRPLPLLLLCRDTCD